MARLWVGIDVGKAHHHLAVVDEHGRTVLSQQMDNDQAAITAIISKVTKRSRSACWAVDINKGPASLLLALLLARGIDVRYVPSSLAAQMAAVFRGERKSLMAKGFAMRG